MRCHICNSVLQEGEVKQDPLHKDFAPCGKCQAIIDEVFEPLTEEEIQAKIDSEEKLLDKTS